SVVAGSPQGSAHSPSHGGRPRRQTSTHRRSWRIWKTTASTSWAVPGPPTDACAWAGLTRPPPTPSNIHPRFLPSTGNHVKLPRVFAYETKTIRPTGTRQPAPPGGHPVHLKEEAPTWQRSPPQRTP